MVNKRAGWALACDVDGPRFLSPHIFHFSIYLELEAGLVEQGQVDEPRVIQDDVEYGPEDVDVQVRCEKRDLF